jgi:hypothetical protein
MIHCTSSSFYEELECSTGGWLGIYLAKYEGGGSISPRIGSIPLPKVDELVVAAAGACWAVPASRLELVTCVAAIPVLVFTNGFPLPSSWGCCEIL